jgi:hypothetical protein
MAPQTSYSINLPAVAYPGQPFDISTVLDKTSALAVAAAIPYGVLVVRDTSNTSGTKIAGKVPAGSTDITAVGSALGVAIADQARSQDPTVTLPTYPQYSAVPCGRVGRFWVVVEEAVTAGQQAYVRYASGAGGTQLGSFRASADSSTAAALPGAYYVSSQTAIGGYAVVELSLA